jgi:hypothetical protein
LLSGYAKNRVFADKFNISIGVIELLHKCEPCKVTKKACDNRPTATRGGATRYLGKSQRQEKP